MIDAETPAEAEADKEVVETAPPAQDPETGVALAGGYPVNHRLRAEALFKAGKEEDPDAIVSNELIADAGARLKADEAAEAARRPAVSTTMTREALDKIASDEGLDPSAYSTKDDVVAAIEAKRASGTEPGRASADPLPPPQTPPDTSGGAAAEVDLESQEG